MKALTKFLCPMGSGSNDRTEKIGQQRNGKRDLY
jgi:hypothetical protein